MIRNCLQPIILLQSVSPGPPKLRNPKYVVTFATFSVLLTLRQKILRTGQWFPSLDGVTEYGLEKLAWRPICLEHLFLCTPSCLVGRGLLEHAFISVSPVGYFPAHFSLSRRGRASVHHCKVISYLLTVEKKDDQLTVKLLGADEPLALLLW